MNSWCPVFWLKGLTDGEMNASHQRTTIEANRRAERNGRAQLASNTERGIPSAEEFSDELYGKTNWGRWGKDDQKGAINLITPEKVRAASRLVDSGRRISLSRDFPSKVSTENQKPAQHFLQVRSKPHQAADGGAIVDYYGINYHGLTTTHLDALSHVWGRNGAWNGHAGAFHMLTNEGVTWGGIEHWKEGLVTRGVLLDVPRHRNEAFVTLGRPVHGWELAEIAESQSVRLESGDALIVYSGREAWDKKNQPWGIPGAPARPGLHPSCLRFLREADCSVLVWDMMDAEPNPLGLRWSVHGAIFSLGLALLDNAVLGTLAEACAQERRYEFLFVALPLLVVGGTGSPVNPIAIL